MLKCFSLLLINIVTESTLRQIKKNQIKALKIIQVCFNANNTSVSWSVNRSKGKELKQSDIKELERAAMIEGRQKPDLDKVQPQFCSC